MRWQVEPMGVALFGGLTWGSRGAGPTPFRCGKQHGKAKYSAAPTKKPQPRVVLRDF
jgi:hypothetical protein